MIKDAPGARLSLATIFLFAIANLPIGALAVAIPVYLPAHFASHLGVPLGIVGGAWALVRLLDVGVDPVLGLVMDRTRTRIGRYRLWMLIGAPILMLATYALFMAHPGIGSIYLVGWLLVLFLGFSILTLGHSAWGATLSTGYNERSRVFGIVTAVGVIGAVTVLIFPIIARSLGHTPSQGVQDMGWFVILSTPVTIAICCLRTRETVSPDLGHPKFRLRDYWSLIVKPDLLRLYFAQMALTLGPGWMSALYLFFFTDSRGYSGEQATLLLLIYILAGIVGAPVTALIAHRLSKHRTLLLTASAYSLGLCTVMLIPKGNFWAGVPMMFWCGFMASGFDLMIRAMLADVGDEVRLEQGQERLSLIYALNTLSGKIAAAFAIGLTYPLVAKLGYVAKEGFHNTPQAIHSLELAYIVGPIFFVMLGGLCVLGWRLDAAKHAQIRVELDRLDAGHALYEEAPILESLGGGPQTPILTSGVPDAASR